MAAAAGSLWRGETERELERALEARRITQSRIRELQAQKEHHGGYLAQLNERVAVLTRHIGEYREMLGERGLAE